MQKQFQCTKIKDGLYLGNRIAAYDLQFLIINKFGYIINCASEVPNVYEQHGIKYLKFKITLSKAKPVFDQELKRLKKMKKFINDAEDQGTCCLLHCGEGNSRSLLMATAYLMDRFKWKLKKCLEYLKSKEIFIGLPEIYIKELIHLEEKISEFNILNEIWDSPYVDLEDQLISKTYKNTLNIKLKQSQRQKKLKKENLIEIEKETKNQNENEKEKENEKKDQNLFKIKRRVQWQDKIDKQRKKKVIAQKQKLKDQKNNKNNSMSKNSKNELQGFYKEKPRQSKQENRSSLKNNRESIKKSKVKIETSHPQEHIQTIKLQKNTKKDHLFERQPILDIISKQENEMQKENQEKDKEKVIKLTINNYINPNINIIKQPPLPEKKIKSKPPIQPKKEKQKINRTLSEKQAFKKTVHEYSKEKRNSNHTPLRDRKERKSQKACK